MLKSATRASADCELPTFECHLQNTACADDNALPIENLTLVIIYFHPFHTLTGSPIRFCLLRCNDTNPASCQAPIYQPPSFPAIRLSYYRRAGSLPVRSALQ